MEGSAYTAGATTCRQWQTCAGKAVVLRSAYQVSLFHRTQSANNANGRMAYGECWNNSHKVGSSSRTGAATISRQCELCSGRAVPWLQDGGLQQLQIHVQTHASNLETEDRDRDPGPARLRSWVFPPPLLSGFNCAVNSGSTLPPSFYSCALGSFGSRWSSGVHALQHSRYF